MSESTSSRLDSKKWVSFCRQTSYITEVLRELVLLEGAVVFAENRWPKAFNKGLLNSSLAWGSKAAHSSVFRDTEMMYALASSLAVLKLGDPRDQQSPPLPAKSCIAIADNIACALRVRLLCQRREESQRLLAAFSGFSAEHLLKFSTKLLETGYGWRLSQITRPPCYLVTVSGVQYLLLASMPCAIYDLL